MTAPEKIWAWDRHETRVCGNAVIRGIDSKWSMEILPDVADSLGAASYTRTDIADAAHRSGYELARAQAAELGAHIVAYDVAMKGRT